jgi:4-oxalomesaconate tautomerase
VAGSSCGALLPTGNPTDRIAGVDVTMIDNGMPVVVIRAADLGRTGAESPAELEADAALKARVEDIRLLCGERMNLGDVRKKTVPKMSLIAPPRAGGALSTRTFIPHRVHDAIGVFGAVSVATACVIPGTVAFAMAGGSDAAGERLLDVEHPTGFFTVEMAVEAAGGTVRVARSALLRTARRIMRGEVEVPAGAWDGRR